MFADDLSISLESNDADSAGKILQIAVDSLQKWSNTTGYKFSPNKTFMVDFSHKWKKTAEPFIKIKGIPIKCKTEAKFLGLTFDNKLNWSEHIKNLKSSCFRTMNILKYLNNKNFGLNRNYLLKIYRTLIRSKIDYGCQIYNTASTSILKNLEVTHNACLRICSSAFPTSPVLSIYCDLSEPPLQFRQLFLSSNLYFKILNYSENPIKSLFQNKIIKSTFVKSGKEKYLLPLRLSKNNIPIKIHSLPQIFSSPPPWIIEVPSTILDMIEIKKSCANDFEIRNQIYEILNSNCKDSIRCYTDGSKTKEGVGCSFSIENNISQFSLRNNYSIYSAELTAIYLCLEKISQSASTKDYVILTDSLSSLQGLQNLYSNHPIIQRILIIHHAIIQSQIKIKFMWIPSHCGMTGNDMVDAAAKEAIKMKRNVNNKTLIYDIQNTNKQNILKKYKII